MNDRRARGSAAARRTKSRPSQRLGGDGSGMSPRHPDRGREDQPTGDDQLSEEIAQEHQAQVNQLRDEPVPSSHHDDRHRQAEQRDPEHD